MKAMRRVGLTIAVCAAALTCVAGTKVQLKRIRSQIVWPGELAELVVNGHDASRLTLQRSVDLGKTWADVPWVRIQGHEQTQTVTQDETTWVAQKNLAGSRLARIRQPGVVIWTPAAATGLERWRVIKQTN